MPMTNFRKEDMPGNRRKPEDPAPAAAPRAFKKKTSSAPAAAAEAPSAE